MIDNRSLILPLLNFEEEGDFYFCMLLLRKKDQPVGERDNHQSFRTIKTYCIKSAEYLEKKWDEIVGLCEMFKARAYIQVQKQNHKDVSLLMMVELATRIKNGAQDQRGLFDSVVGQMKMLERRWVLDLDFKDEKQVEIVRQIIHMVPPIGNKILAEIPTKQGIHLITSPFNSQQFKFHLPHDINVDIQKRNPSLLFFPNSLEF